MARRDLAIDQMNQMTARFTPMKARNGRWSLVTSASGKIEDVGAIVIQNQTIQGFIERNLLQSNSLTYMVIYGTLVIFFAYFYTAISFNPTDVADNMKKYGGFVPGIRPGRQTAEYLDRILTRITLPGAIFVAIIALLPDIVRAWQNLQAFPFGGTSILIAVGVTLETMKQIESQLTMRHYEGFLK
jgi:preprotein translocase subunit SecY